MSGKRAQPPPVKMVPTVRTVGDGGSAISSFRNALNDQSFSDVVFVLDDGNEYHAHKCILAARSDAFKAMLFGETQEAQTGRVVVKGINSAYFYTILEWAYTGMATMSAADVLGVLQLAGFYVFSDLEKHCRDLAMSFIDVNNAFILLNSAVENGEEDIVTKCLEFLKSNLAEAIDSPSWLKLCNSGIHDILSQQQMDVSEFVLFTRTCEWIDDHAENEQHRVALMTSLLPRIRLSQLTVPELLNNVKPVVNGYGVQQKEYVEALEYKLAPEHFRNAKSVDRLCPRVPTLHQRIVQNVNRRFLNGWRCICELEAGAKLPNTFLQEVSIYSTSYIAVGESCGQTINLMAVGSVDVALRKARSHTPTPLQDGSIYWFNVSQGISAVFGFSPTADQRVTFDVTPSERDRKLLWEVAETDQPLINTTLGVTRFIYVK